MNMHTMAQKVILPKLLDIFSIPEVWAEFNLFINSKHAELL